ncbi:hypothetical protein Tco_1430445 [Tanacetum coccineum]
MNEEYELVLPDLSRVGGLRSLEKELKLIKAKVDCNFNASSPNDVKEFKDAFRILSNLAKHVKRQGKISQREEMPQNAIQRRQRKTTRFQDKEFRILQCGDQVLPFQLPIKIFSGKLKSVGPDLAHSLKFILWHCQLSHAMVLIPKGQLPPYGSVKNHKKTVKNGQARTRESEEFKKKPKIQSRSQKSQASVKSSQR